MLAKSQKAAKRKIPKRPGKTRCPYTFEVDGETVMMRVDCRSGCGDRQGRRDVCWANLVRGVSDTAIPDRIMLCGEQTVICDRVLVSLIRNAALIVRRVETRLEELRRTGRIDDSPEADRLNDLLRAILYDVPQLISRDFGVGGARKGRRSEEHDDFAMAGEVLAKKSGIDLSCHIL